MKGSEQEATIPASAEALAFVRAMYGMSEAEPITLEGVLSRAILGSQTTRTRLLEWVEDDEPLTLERLEQVLVTMRESQEVALHQMTKTRQVAAKAGHTLDDCAAAILARTTPQVMEQMEYAMQATQRPAWQVMAGTMIMWKNDLIGADFTEVQVEGSGVSMGPQLWTAPGPSQPRGGSTAAPVCQACQQPFQPGPHQHRPAFGCDVCGGIAPLFTRNLLEVQRASEVSDRVATIQPVEASEWWRQLGDPRTWEVGYAEYTHPYWRPWITAALAYLGHEHRKSCTCGLGVQVA